MRSKKKPRPAGQPPLVDSAAERIAVIIDGAERAAARVIDDAEEQARRNIETAQEQANRLAAERLRAMADELDPPASLPPEDAQPRLRSVDGMEPEPPASGSAPADAAGARLLATQMAVSGSRREEIEARLRNGFEIEDVDSILDAILGPEE